MISKDELMPIKEKEFLVLLEGFVEGYGCTLIQEVPFGEHIVCGHIPELNIIIEYLENDKKHCVEDYRKREEDIKEIIYSQYFRTDDCHFIYVSDKYAHSFNLGVIARELERLCPLFPIGKEN